MDSDLQEDTKKSAGLYWDRLEIIFKVFRFMGYIPYKVCDENDKIESSVQTWLWVGFASLVQVVIIATSDYMHCDDIYWDTYDKTLESLIRLLFTNNIILILATWSEHSKIIKYVNGWHLFIRKLEAITLSHVTCFSRNKLRNILMCFAIITLSGNLLDQFTLQGGFHPFFLLSYFISVFVGALFPLFWVANCIFIIQVARCFKDNFFNTLLTKCDPSLLDKYRLLWIQLRHNAINFAASFTGSVGLLIFMNALSLTFSIYSLMTAIIYTRTVTRVIGLITPVVWNSATLMVICELSDMVGREIGQQFVSKLLSFKLSTQNYRMLISDEMDSLFNTLDINSPDFVLHGCLTLNRGLLIIIFSSIVTYIIVLIQFDLSEGK